MDHWLAGSTVVAGFLMWWPTYRDAGSCAGKKNNLYRATDPASPDIWQVLSHERRHSDKSCGTESPSREGEFGFWDCFDIPDFG